MVLHGETYLYIKFLAFFETVFFKESFNTGNIISGPAVFAMTGLPFINDLMSITKAYMLVI